MKQIKIILTTLCGTALLSACSGDGAVKKEKTNDRIELGLKGEVKKMAESVSNTPNSAHISTFNETGYFIEKAVFMNKPFRMTAVTNRYEYDTDGKLAVISFFSILDGGLDRKNLYNKEGNITEEQSYGKNPSGGKANPYKLKSTLFYTYNDEGTLIKRQSNENEKGRSEYECDGANNILKQTDFFNGEPSLICRFGYEYDKRGNITKKVTYHEEKTALKEDWKVGQITDMTESKFDDMDRLLELRVSTYRFDSEKKESEVSQTKVFNYKYDEKGNKIEMASTICDYRTVDKEGTVEEKCSAPVITTYTYTYDKHDNWTLCEIKEGNRAMGSLQRSFVYYGEEPPGLSSKNLVGAWDYYGDPSEKFEIVFKKDGTLIDFYDFHTTGTYQVNPDGSVLTIHFIYNGNEEKPQPMDFKIVEFTDDRFVVEVPNGNRVTYERKAKSDNYEGEY